MLPAHSLSRSCGLCESTVASERDCWIPGNFWVGISTGAMGGIVSVLLLAGGDGPLGGSREGSFPATIGEALPLICKDWETTTET